MSLEDQYLKAISDIQKIILMPGTWQWTEWQRKYAWFPILHDDWSITWLRWYKVRYHVYHRINIFDRHRYTEAEYIVEFK